MNYVVYTIRLTPADSHSLSEIAAVEDRRRSEVLRRLIRREAQRLGVGNAGPEPANCLNENEVTQTLTQA